MKLKPYCRLVLCCLFCCCLGLPPTGGLRAAPWYQVELIVFEHLATDYDGELWHENPGLPGRQDSIQLLFAEGEKDGGEAEEAEPFPADDDAYDAAEGEALAGDAAGDAEATAEADAATESAGQEAAAQDDAADAAEGDADETAEEAERERLTPYLVLAADYYQLAEVEERLETSADYRLLLHTAWQQPGLAAGLTRSVYLDNAVFEQAAEAEAAAAAALEAEEDAEETEEEIDDSPPAWAELDTYPVPGRAPGPVYDPAWMPGPVYDSSQSRGPIYDPPSVIYDRRQSPYDPAPSVYGAARTPGSIFGTPSIYDPRMPGPVYETDMLPEEFYQPPTMLYEGIVRLRSSHLIYADIDFSFFPERFLELQQAARRSQEGEAEPEWDEDNPPLDPDLADYVRLTETRRIKLNEIHYFDHPLFGVILQVSRLREELDEESAE